MTDFVHEHPNFDCSFEIRPHVCELKGGMRVTIYEEGEKGPQEHITIDNDWWLDIEWYLHGDLVRHLCGSYCVGVHLESLGVGEEYSLPAVEVPMDPCGDGHYRYRYKVEAGKIKATDCGSLYIVAVTLTSKDHCGTPGHISAYCKEGCLMFTLPPA